MFVQHRSCPAPSDRRAALSFAVVGDGGDRKVFVDAIRALALVKRFGDRMTLIGYGRHRRSLTKWAVALQVDHHIMLGDQNAPGQLPHDAYDVVIACDSEQAAIALSVNGTPCARIVRGDRIALAGALMMPETNGGAGGFAPIDRSDCEALVQPHRLLTIMPQRLPR